MNIMNMPSIKLESSPSKSTTSSRSDYTKTDFKKYLKDSNTLKSKKEILNKDKDIDRQDYDKNDLKAKDQSRITDENKLKSNVDDNSKIQQDKEKNDKVNSKSNEDDISEISNEELNEIYEQILSALLADSKVNLDSSNESLGKFELFNNEYNILENISANLDAVKDILSQKLKELGVTDITASEGVNQIINDLVALLKDTELNPSDLQFKKKIEDIINKYFSESSSKNSDNQIITRLKAELANVYSESNNNVTNNTDSENNSQNNSSENLFKDKSEKVLRSIIDEEDKSTKLINRSANFMTQILKNEKIDVVKPQQNIVVNRNTFPQDIIKAVNFMNSNDIQNLSVKILPKELGEMFISVTMESGVMKAQISAANKETMNLLNTHMQDITDKLNNSNIKIQDVKIDIYNDDTTFFSQQFNQNNGREQGNNQSRNRNIEGTSNIAIDSIDINEQLEQDSDSNVNTLV